MLCAWLILHVLYDLSSFSRIHTICHVETHLKRPRTKSRAVTYPVAFILPLNQKMECAVSDYSSEVVREVEQQSTTPNLHLSFQETS